MVVNSVFELLEPLQKSSGAVPILKSFFFNVLLFWFICYNRDILIFITQRNALHDDI